MKGYQNINIPPGTTDGTEIKIKGQGMKKLHSETEEQTGSHIIKLRIDIPTKLNEKQKKALKAYAEVETQPINFWLIILLYAFPCLSIILLRDV